MHKAHWLEHLNNVMASYSTAELLALLLFSIQSVLADKNNLLFFFNSMSRLKTPYNKLDVMKICLVK